MKTIVKIQFAFAILFFSAMLPACKKAGADSVDNGSADFKAQLVGTPGNVWQLQDADASTVWEDQVSKGWVQYTNQPGHINLSDCVKNNDYMVFNADQTYTQSIYTCNLFETNFPLFSQPGGSGKWTLSPDRTLSFENYATYRFISATATDLYIADLYGTYHFVSVSKHPFLTPAQYLGGNENKTWKISKITNGGVIQPLTASQTANRLNFNVNGSLTNSFTNTTYGQPITGNWTYNANQHNAVYNLQASGQTPAVTQHWTVLELTETALTYYYFDDQNHYFTMYWVPQ
jgi:hypothetical protein